MKLATWNVNSLKVRLPQVLDWLARHSPGVLCLQETKLRDDLFPAAELRAAGYESLANGQKTYNGVAILRLDVKDPEDCQPRISRQLIAQPVRERGEPSELVPVLVRFDAFAVGHVGAD